MASILILDDEEKLAEVFQRVLARDGHKVVACTDGQAALDLLAREKFEIVLSDLRMPGLSGIEVLERARRFSPDTDFVIMTAYATVQTAIEAMKLGAIDYLIKPVNLDELKSFIGNLVQTRVSSDDTGQHPVAAAPSADAPAGGLEDIVAESPAMRAIIAKVRKVAASGASVLLTGESGTGKEVFARAIHRLSPRTAAPLIIVNCGAIPEPLMESELFGHAKGAFTGATDARRGHFEQAHGGTIFLDEISEMPLHLQVKLLRVLQEQEVVRVGESHARKVDVRVLAATNRDLEQDATQGRFRQDLYFRINVIPIALPPLRERREDLPLLIRHYLARHQHQGALSLTPEAEALLLGYHYPGNIRELVNAVEHAATLAENGIIQIADLPLAIQNASPSAAALPAARAEDMRLEDLEKQAILRALEKTRFNYTRAANHLGITRRTLGYRIQKYGLTAHVEEQARLHRAARDA